MSERGRVRAYKMALTILSSGDALPEFVGPG